MVDIRFAAVFVKDVKVLLRDPQSLVVLLAMPVVFIVILSFALGPAFEVESIKLDLPVVDHDRGEQSGRLAQLLQEVDGVTVELHPSEEENRVRDDVRKGDDVAALVIPDTFSEQLEAGETAELLVLVDPAETTGGSIVRGVVLGTAQRLASEGQAVRLVGTIFGQLPAGADNEALQRQVEQQVVDQIRAGQGLDAIDVATEVAGTEDRDEPDVHEQNVPGYTVLAVFFLVTSLSTSILVERRDGTFRRLLASPIRRSDILLGKLLAFLVVGLAQIAALFAFGRIVFGMHLGDAPLGLVIVSVALVLAATGLGVLVATVARTEQRAGALGSLLVLAMAALGGSMVPRFVMPEAMQTVGLVTPHAWAIDGFQDIIVRNEGVVAVLPQSGVLLGFAGVFFLLGVLRFRFE